MTDRIEALRADIAYVSEALVALHDEMGDEPTEDQSSRFDEGVSFVDTARAELERHNARIEAVNAVRAAAQIPGAVVSSIPENVNVNRAADPFDLSNLSVFSTRSDLRGRALSAVEAMSGDDSARSAAVDTLEKFDDARGSIALRYLATGSDDYRSAFGKLLTGRSYALTPAEQVAVDRAASLTDASGGYAIPFLLDPTVMLTNSGTNNPFRQISRIVRGTSDKWQGVTSAGVTASWDGEAAEVSDDAPTLAQPSIEAFKAQAFVPFSMEIADDWAGLESEVAMMLADAKDRLEGAAFATGSGTNEPVGIVTALVAGSRTTSTSTSNAIVLADVYTVAEAIGPRFRRNASWVMPYAILNDIRQLGTSNNYNGFTVDLTAASVPSLLGKPVYESSDMDSIYGSGENYVAVHGDFSNYVIFDRVGMSVELIPHLFATQNNRPSGQRGFYASWRVGADSVNDNAFTVLNVT
jgi:HK97 family phage major capsid protein